MNMQELKSMCEYMMLENLSFFLFYSSFIQQVENT